MSAVERKAFMQEALDLSHWYRSWATLKHGLPDKQGRNVLPDEPEERPEPQVIPIPYLTEKTVSELTSKAATVTPPVVPQVPTIGSRILAGVLGASLLAGGAGAGGLAAWLAGRDNATVPPAVAPIEPGPIYGDLLQWLNQEGYNLPPESGVTR